MIYVGKIVNTHGIKGEIRLLSDFEYKDLVFKKDFPIYIENKKEIIESYRKHKMFDMITLKGIYNINEVLKYKGKKVYIEKSSLPNVIFQEDYIGLDVYTDHFIGTITNIMKVPNQDILVIKNKDKKYLVPNRKEFIKDIDFENHKIKIENIKGLIDED